MSALNTRLLTTSIKAVVITTIAVDIGNLVHTTFAVIFKCGCRMQIYIYNDAIQFSLIGISCHVLVICKLGEVLRIWRKLPWMVYGCFTTESRFAML